MKIEVNIEKKHFFILLGIILFFGTGMFVYAYTTDGSGNPSVMGHSPNEIDWNQQINNDLSVNGDICINGNCNNWESIGGLIIGYGFDTNGATGACSDNDVIGIGGTCSGGFYTCPSGTHRIATGTEVVGTTVFYNYLCVLGT